VRKLVLNPSFPCPLLSPALSDRQSHLIQINNGRAIIVLVVEFLECSRVMENPLITPLKSTWRVTV
jgi:hypothetical protein